MSATIPHTRGGYPSSMDMLDGITLDSEDKTREVMDDAHRFLQSLEAVNGAMSGHVLAYVVNDELVITMRPDGENCCDVRFMGGGRLIVDAQLYIEDEEVSKTNENMSIHDTINLIRDYGPHDEDDDWLNSCFFNRSMMVIVDPGDDLIEVLKEGNGVTGLRYEMTRTRDKVLKATRLELEDGLRSDDSSKELKALFKSILDSGDDAVLGYLYKNKRYDHILDDGYYDDDYNYWSPMNEIILEWLVPNDNNKMNESFLPFSGVMNGRKTVKESDKALSGIEEADPSQRVFAYKPVGTNRYVVRGVLGEEELNPDAKIFIINCE